jgi:hypothetical protein
VTGGILPPFLARSSLESFRRINNLASQSCGVATRTIAPSKPSHAWSSSAGGRLVRQRCRRPTPISCAAGAKVLCRRLQRYIYVSVVERPQQCSDQQLEIVEGTSPRGLTYLCTEEAVYIYSAPLYICRVVDFLLRQRRGAGLVCDSAAALASASCNEHVAKANNIPRALHGAHPKRKQLPGERPRETAET